MVTVSKSKRERKEPLKDGRGAEGDTGRHGQRLTTGGRLLETGGPDVSTRGRSLCIKCVGASMVPNHEGLSRQEVVYQLARLYV